MARIALIGPDQQDNLPLRYLAASLFEAGHDATLIRFNNRHDRKSCIDEVLVLQPDIAGLGISFQHAVNDYLELADELRRAGFTGHITCGGHVPTFCYSELLADSSAIDTAVRHEGEHTLCELARAVESGRSPAGIRGVVWRDGARIAVEPSREPVRDLDTLPAPKLRDRGPLAVGGVPIAFIITARGCFGACTYCSIQSFSRDAGGPRLRLRAVDPVADEIADHFVHRNVRTFFFQDDLFILPNTKRTLKRMSDLKTALDARGVAAPVFWVKARPESVTDEVARAAREMGVVHVFLGIENASDERLRYLGRTHTHTHNLSAVRILEQNGIRPSFNLMLLDPDCTLEDVATTMDFAASVPHLPWNVCRTEIYAGTPLLRRLRDEGRLTGDYRSFGYEMRDTRAETMFRILRVSLHERAFAVSSLLNKLISISFARQAHEAFFPGGATADISRAVDALLIDAHLDTVDEMRRALDYAASQAAAPDADVREFAVASALRINRQNKAFYERFRDLWTLLNARGAARWPGALKHAAPKF